MREEVEVARSMASSPVPAPAQGMPRSQGLSLRRSSMDIESGGADGRVPMSALGRTYNRLANHQKVGVAVRHGARIVDDVGFGVAMMLRQYPPARLFFLLYVVFMHAYIWFIMFHLHGHLEHDHNIHHGHVAAPHFAAAQQLSMAKP